MQDLELLIENATFLASGDKEFLRAKLPSLTPVEKLQLRHTIQSGKVPQVLEKLHTIRAKFNSSENKDKPQNDIISKVVQKVIKPRPPKIVSHSFLNQPELLGGPTPKPPQYNQVSPINSLSDIVSIAQLKYLTMNHVSFLPNQNPEVEIQKFVEKVETLLEKTDSITERRDRFMYLLSSPLFRDYINTGLTAERHPELKPTSIILNTLHQIDPSKYLNGKQFRYTSILVSQCRLLCGL